MEEVQASNSSNCEVHVRKLGVQSQDLQYSMFVTTSLGKGRLVF